MCVRTCPIMVALLVNISAVLVVQTQTLAQFGVCPSAQFDVCHTATVRDRTDGQVKMRACPHSISKHNHIHIRQAGEDTKFSVFALTCGVVIDPS